MGKIPVRDDVCINCFYNNECGYKNNEGSDLSHFISTDDGNCISFKPMNEHDLIPSVGNNEEEDSNVLNSGFLHRIED